jgi:uncharacterized membrane protein YoaK (UPF0700 family)
MGNTPGNAAASPFAPADNPASIAHLNTLQGIITRLAGNSAQCKTWCLTLVTALIAFAGTAHNVGPIKLAILPIAMFLVLDAAYLGVEKAYRDLYNDVVRQIRRGSYALDGVFAAGAGLTLGLWFKSQKSWSIWAFYYPLIIAYIVVVSCSGLAAILAGLK